MEIKDIIQNVYEEKISDGTVRKIISEHFDKMLHDILNSEMNWSGEAYKLTKEKMKPLIIGAIEGSDLGVMLEKIVVLFNEGMKNTPIESYKNTLESINTLFSTENKALKFLEGKKSVKMSEIWKAYTEYVQERIDKYAFESGTLDNDGEGDYTYLNCRMGVLEKDSDWIFLRNGYEVELTTSSESFLEDKPKADIRFRLEQNYDNTALILHTDFYSMTLSDLRHAPSFFILLWAIERKYLNIELDVDGADEMVFVRFED